MQEDPWETSSDGPEGIRRLLVRGFRVWSNNLVIAVPVALGPLTALLWTAILLLAFLSINPPPESLLTAAAANNQALLAGEMLKYLRGALNLLAAIAPIWLLGSMLLSAFFDAGAIGMAIEANELYRCSLRDAVRYGRKHFLRLFAADLIMLLLYAATVAAFVAPMIASGTPPSQFGADPLMALPVLGVLILAFLFLPVRYALVSEGLGPVEALTRGATFTTKNPIAVLLLIISITALSLLANLPAGALGSPGTPAAAAMEQLYSFSVSVLFVGPYSTVLWARLYLDRTGRPLVEKSRNP